MTIGEFLISLESWTDSLLNNFLDLPLGWSIVCVIITVFGLAWFFSDGGFDE